MGKQGPCYHCGVTSTPLWRNGPPDKPVLCNACGSRWRTKGTLLNYTPLHARSRPHPLLLKTKDNSSSSLTHHKGPDEDTSNISTTSASASSNSDSSTHSIAPSQSSLVWNRNTNTSLPSRKRTCTQQSSVQKLTRDLCTILHQQQSSCISDHHLIFETDTPMVSVEIGHGSVLIRHPNSHSREDQSEATSHSQPFSCFTTLPVYNANNFSKLNINMLQAQYNRDYGQNLPILENRDSPLCRVHLQDIINFEEFASRVTNDEQQQLLKYLHPIDTARLPASLKSMFDSPQFMENLFSFQKLLAEGNLDLSTPAMENEGSRTLKKLALCNVTKRNWVEQYNLLQDAKCQKDSKGSVVTGVLDTIAPGCSGNVQRSRDMQFQSFAGLKSTITSPKAVFMKGSHEHKELMDNDGTGFSPRSLFALPPDNSSLMLDYFRYANECSHQDLLLDVPSHSSFPQAELLPTSSFVAQASTASSSTYQSFVHP